MLRTRRAFLPKQHRAAHVRALAPDNGTISIVFTTGADVPRQDPFNSERYIERLLTGPENVRLDRLNAGAPFLDTHDAWSLGSVIGSVVPGSARMEDGQGVCDIKLSKSARAADTVQDVLDGVIVNISVGYDVHAFTRTEASNGSPAVMTASDWEPMEVSAVPIPADPGAQISARTRSAAGLEVHPCIVTTAQKGTTMTTSLSESQRGFQHFSRLRNKPVDTSALARLGTVETAALQNPDVAQAAIAAQLSLVRAVFARAFPGREAPK